MSEVVERSRGGRPPKAQEEQLQMISMRLHPDTVKRLKELASELGISQAQLVTQALAHYDDQKAGPKLALVRERAEALLAAITEFGGTEP